MQLCDECGEEGLVLFVDGEYLCPECVPADSFEYDPFDDAELFPFDEDEDEDDSDA